MNPSITSLPWRVLGTAILTAIILPMAHGGGEGSSDEEQVRDSGNKVSTIEANDSLEVSLDVFGYISRSQGNDWRQGEPLGAGGKIPLAYDLSLYREEPFNKSYSYQKDLLPLYQDFSYIPLWQPNQLETRLNYRFFPRVWGTVSIDFNDAPTKADGKVVTNTPQINELLFKWGPESVQGLSFSIGKLRLFGDYSPVFDQFPLEKFRLSGIVANYKHSFATGGGVRFRLGAGGQFLGRTQSIDSYIYSNGSNSQSLSYAFLDGIRERYHLYGTGHWSNASSFSLGFLAGFQLVPSDSTFATDQDLINSPTASYHRWPRTVGWQAGGEAGYRMRNWNNQLTVSYGMSDVEMGWSSPDAVQDVTMDTIMNKPRFSRMGSSLLQTVYWSCYQGQKIRMEGGAWWQDRMPAKKWAVSYAANSASGLDTFNLQAQEFRAYKVTFQPSLTINGPFRIGLRWDHIGYLDPKAHTNTIEPLSNSTIVRTGSRDPTEPIGPSLWEREAVNCDLVTQYAEIDIATGFQVRASWSGALYSDAVWRQGKTDSFHANAALSAWLTYHFGMSQEKTQSQLLEH